MPFVGEIYLVNGPNNFKDVRQNDKDGVIAEEYYMHYKNLDHRLDNWVSINEIDIDSGPQSKDLYHIDSPTLNDERLTRLQKRKKGVEDIQINEPFDSSNTVEDPPIKSISYIQFGAMEIECWYVSKYPEVLHNDLPITKLWICQYCLFYIKTQEIYTNHMLNCKKKQPPGIEIYRKGSISVYEVDGKIDMLYCQNLCLMSKLFLDHKAVYFDVEPFKFYILTYVNKCGAHFIGYFSKEKKSIDGNNLACLLILPPFQKHGFGNFLISLSYELSKLEDVVGRPEKPLSDLGLASYKKYWCKTLLKTIKLHGQTLPIKDLSKLTSITQDDILSTLKAMNMTKYWKCKHVICVSNKQLDEALEKVIQKSTESSHNDQYLSTHKPKFEFDPSFLSWKPDFLANH